MTSPTLRPSPPVPHQLPTSTVSFPQSSFPPVPCPTRLSPVLRTIPQCVFSPRCGRAALSVSRPLNNALTEEAARREEGGQRRVTDGFREKNSPSGSTPPIPPDLWPPINIPSIWQTPGCTRVGSPVLFRESDFEQSVRFCLN